MDPEGIVFIVDDDEAFRESLGRLLESAGMRVRKFPGAEAFLEGYDPTLTGCLVLDIRMPGMSGLELQDKLAKLKIGIPIIILSAHGDVETAVRVMHGGAVDFIRKPYDTTRLLERLCQALSLDARRRQEEAERAEVSKSLARLTPREHEVMLLLASGKSVKEIAFGLGLSQRTVNVHRGHIMTKLRIDSVVDLATMARVAEEDAGGNGQPEWQRKPA
ncbi:MAG: response regulator transcription factor [Phycisphaerae bacterium]